MTVYLDIIFIENILMNFIILFATGYILKVKRNPIRLILSSLIGRNIFNISIYSNNRFIF